MTYRKITANKLEQNHKHEVIQMLAAFEKPTTIVEHLKARHGIAVSERNIYFYQENRKEDIERERKRIRADLLAIPIANKFMRLQIRDKLLNVLMKNLENKIGKEGRDPLIINRILDSVHKEMEPFETTVTEQLESLPLVEKPEYEFMINYLKKLSPEEFEKFSELTTRKNVLEELAKADGEFKKFLKEIEQKRRTMERHEGTL